MDSTKEARLDSETCEVIGRLAVACSFLDARFTELIAALSKLHILDALTIVHHQQFSSKHSSLCALLQPPNTEQPLKDVLCLVNRAKEIYDVRNSLVHGYFTFENDRQQIVRWDARGRLKVRRQVFDLDQARAVAAEALLLEAQLTQIVARYRELQFRESE